MNAPVLLLSFYGDQLLMAAAEALARGGYTNVHAAIRLAAAVHRTRHLTSCTTLPDETAGDDATLEALLALSRKTGAAALLPVRTDDVLFVAKHRERLAGIHPAPVPDARLVSEVCHKLAFTRLAETHGLPVPRTVAVQPDLDAATVAGRLGLPLLAKPVIGESGAGIQRVETVEQLRTVISQAGPTGHSMLQEEVPGEDVALTLLADHGKAFAVIMRKRWFRRRNASPFRPMRDLEFFHHDWLEELGGAFVRATRFNGIADFDLRVDVQRRRAWFLECDPRLMGTTCAMAMFGVNVPCLLVDQALGQLPAGYCARAEAGHFLSMRSLPAWLASGAWRQPRHGPLRMRWRSLVDDTIAALHQMLKPRRA